MKQSCDLWGPRIPFFPEMEEAQRPQDQPGCEDREAKVAGDCPKKKKPRTSKPREDRE